jgi:hypothetical protein
VSWWFPETAETLTSQVPALPEVRWWTPSTACAGAGTPSLSTRIRFSAGCASSRPNDIAGQWVSRRWHAIAGVTEDNVPFSSWPRDLFTTLNSNEMQIISIEERSWHIVLDSPRSVPRQSGVRFSLVVDLLLELASCDFAGTKAKHLALLSATNLGFPSTQRSTSPIE